jgi:crotonobetaine/carnitine-CoA ligase
VLTVPGLLAQTSQRFPDRPFLTVREPSGSCTVLSYRQTQHRAGALAVTLAAHGVGPGTRVVVVLPNQIELVCLWFAVTALGATLVPLNPRLTDPELAALVAHADPVLLLLDADRPALAGWQVLRTDRDLDAAVALHEGAPMPIPADSRAPAAVLYTSGSVGRPKGCLLSHDSFVLPAGHLAGRLGINPRDVALHVLPLHHMAGLSFLTTALTVGASVELVPRFSGSQFWQQAVASGATIFRHLGEMLAVVCAQPTGPADQDHQLRLAYGAGARPEVAARFTARFGVPTVDGYGLSETNTVLAGAPGEAPPGILGQPLPHVRVRLMGAGGEVRGVGAGELQVAPNPALMLGYLRAPELTATAFEDGWYRTGDRISRDAAGQLRFEHRLSQVIRRRGENIDPTEIERVAESFVGVRRAAAIGVAAEFDGTDIKLYLEVVPGQAVSTIDVRAHCAGQLASFKVPRYVEIIDQLPVTATHKLDKVALHRLTLLPQGTDGT